MEPEERVLDAIRRFPGLTFEGIEQALNNIPHWTLTSILLDLQFGGKVKLEKVPKERGSGTKSVFKIKERSAS